MEYFITAVHFILTINSIILLLYGAHVLYLLMLDHKHGDNCISQDIKMPDNVPIVTLQLPVFNERYVIDRLLDAVVLMRYPREKLDIQVLDDSTDDTREIIADRVSHLREQGWNIRHLHRTNRIDYKGGALREGLKSARGEYIAVFDTDFVPNEDFLIKTLPELISDEHIAMVQTRWGHTNASDSYMTHAQSISIDAHFLIEQTARNGSGLWMNFNGTAGIWRKAAIIDAGDWSGDTLTEDMDLSYRALLKGWRFKYLKDVINPAELPPTIGAFRSQQFRWAKGSIQTGMKLLPSIWKSTFPLKKKIFSTFHLLSYGVHFFIILGILLLSLSLMLNPADTFVLYNNVGLNMARSIFYILNIFVSLCPIAYYLLAQLKIGQSAVKALCWMPVTLLFGIGLSVNNALACVEAVIGKKSEFVRTPKFNKVKSDGVKRSIYGVQQIKPVMVLELIAFIYVSALMLVAIERNYFSIMPLVLSLCVGYALVLFETCRMLLAQRRIS